MGSFIILKTLKPENIKKGVEILGVTGTFEGGTVIHNEDITLDSSTVEQVAVASEGYTGLGTVTVNPYTLDSSTVDPSTSAQTVVSDEDGLSSVTLNPVTAAIDPNITPGNIKAGVTILGVTGTFDNQHDWVIEAKSGTGTLDVDTGLSGQNYGLYKLLDHSKLTSVTLRDTSVTGEEAMNGFLGNNTYLTSLSMPDLMYVDVDNAPFYDLCAGSSNLVSIVMSPEFFKDYDMYDSMSRGMSYVSDISINIPQGYAYLNGYNVAGGTTYLLFNCFSSLSDATVLHILQQLGNVTDYDQVAYTVLFPTMTIQDDASFTYTQAVQKLTSEGWSVQGLTIDAPAYIDITSGDSLNLKNDDTITFNAMYSWTATVSDASLSLSAYSGSAGQSQSVVVTMDPSWEGSATVRFSCSDGTFTQFKDVRAYYNNAQYTRLQWAQVGGDSGQYCDTGVELDQYSKMRLDFECVTYAGGKIVSTTVTDDYVNEWRTFGFNGDMYFDLGGGGFGSSRMYVNGGCQPNVRHNYEFGKYYVADLDNLNTYYGPSDSPFTSTSGDSMKIGGGYDVTIFYDLEFKVDGTNVSDHFVPAKDQNDVVGFWDMINDVFITPNYGTIIGGPEY